MTKRNKKIERLREKHKERDRKIEKCDKQKDVLYKERQIEKEIQRERER